MLTRALVEDAKAVPLNPAKKLSELCEYPTKQGAWTEQQVEFEVGELGVNGQL